jgi:solute carrier family 31 (copper transporter), member 1
VAVATLAKYRYRFTFKHSVPYGNDCTTLTIGCRADALELVYRRRL